MAKRKGSLLRRMFGISLMAGAAYAIWRAIEANQAQGDGEWRAQPFPFPPQPRSDADADADERDSTG